MIIDFIIEDLMLNSYLQKNFHTLIKNIILRSIGVFVFKLFIKSV